MARRNLKDYLSDDTLDLSLNDLQDVPVKDIAQLPKATSLDLSNNKLTVLGKSFAASLTHLVKLDLARNELKELPKNFGLLVNLKYLDLYKNKLETLPLSFGNLRALKWLDLKENPLERHWQQIAGPCLNAQDCKNAAKNVVNIASTLSSEIDAEVQRSQSRQKQQEEQEQKEQAKKKDKQREKKKRKAAAKHAEASLAKTIENGATAATETIRLVDEVYSEPPNTSRYVSKFTLSGFLANLCRTLLYLVLTVVLLLFYIRYFNEPLYKRITSHLFREPPHHLFTSLVPGHVQQNVVKMSANFLHVMKDTFINVWSICSKMLQGVYVFVMTDPRFGIYVNNFIRTFTHFYVFICEYSCTLFNAVLQPIIYSN